MNRFQSKKEIQTTIIAHKRKEVSQCPEVQAVKRFIKAL